MSAEPCAEKIHWAVRLPLVCLAVVCLLPSLVILFIEAAYGLGFYIGPLAGVAQVKLLGVWDLLGASFVFFPGVWPLAAAALAAALLNPISENIRFAVAWATVVTCFAVAGPALLAFPLLELNPIRMHHILRRRTCFGIRWAGRGR